MYKVKGGAARGLSNEDYNLLYNIGFDEGDIEMMEYYNPYITLQGIIGEYIRFANENYGANISDIQVVTSNNSDELPNSNVNKRNVARDVVFYFSNEGRISGGYRKRSRKIKTRILKKLRSKRRGTRKNRKHKKLN